MDRMDDHLSLVGNLWTGWAVLGMGLGMLAGGAGRVLLAGMRRGTAIPPPWCELAVGVLWAALGGAAAAGLVPLTWVPLLAGAAWLAVVLGAVDLREHRLPDALTLPAFPAVVALVAPLGWGAVGRALAGGILLVAVHLVVHTVSPAALGLGDVKLAGPVGVCLAAGSWSALLLGCALMAVLSGLLGAAVGARALVGGRPAAPVGVVAREGPLARGRPQRAVPELPHGPSMLAAAWLTALAAAVGTASEAGLVGGVGGAG
jgi:leader peptidase (prepilin peptidase)/N-methyltransferase